MLKLSYKFKKLDPDDTYKLSFEPDENPATSGFFGSGIGGPGFIQRGKNLINKILPGEPMSKIQTPPLGNTPVPNNKLFARANVNPNTNLTRTQTALLSPEEQVIASRRT